MRIGKFGTMFPLSKFSCLTLLLVSSHFIAAQAGRGSISGLVVDSTGAIIPGASVTAKNIDTGSQLSTKSTVAGLYSFISLSPGHYEISASARGFDTLVQKNVLVTIDQTSTVNLSLKVGSVAQVVTVTEAPDLIDTSNSTVGQLINA